MERMDRRRFLAAGVGSTIGLLAGCTSPGTTDLDAHPIDEPVTEWPSFRGDQYNTGYARGVEPASADPAVEWTYDADGPFWGSPIVVDGTTYIGSADGSVYAIDAETGDEEWSFATEGRIEGSPAYADGTVFIGSYDMGVYAIDAASGDEAWHREFGRLIRSSPAVVDGTLVIGVGCHNLACGWYAEEAEVPEDGSIVALDATSGETLWEYPVDDEVVSTPAVGGSTAYVGASNGTLYALALDSGDEVWSYDATDMIWSSPAVAFETVYVGDWGGIVHAVDAASGDERWTADPFSQYISGSVAVDEDAVYVGDTPHNSLDDPGSYKASVYKFDASSGDELWSFETNALEIGSSPVVTEERLYVGTHGQTEREGVGVHAFTTDGQEEWFYEVGGRGVGSSPALIDGTLYFGGADKRVYALR